MKSVCQSGLKKNLCNASYKQESYFSENGQKCLGSKCPAKINKLFFCIFICISLNDYLYLLKIGNLKKKQTFLHCTPHFFLNWPRCPGPRFLSKKKKSISAEMERTGALVKPRTFGREVPGSSPPVAVRCGLGQVTYPQLLR